MRGKKKRAFSARDRLMARSVEAKRESKRIDFKQTLDIAQEPGAWCELVKDIVAMANSGGGAIVVGVCNDGSYDGSGVENFLTLDPAVITDQIAKYTGVQFDGFEMREAKRARKRVAVLLVDAVRGAPIVFIKPGTYQVFDKPKQNQKTAFSLGTIYFRHGAKSEPANRADLEAYVSRAQERLRKQWMSGLAKISTMDGDAELVRVTRRDEGGMPISVRITDDPDAPEMRAIDTDETHPYRLKETVRILRDSQPSAWITTHTVQCIIKAHDVKAQRRFCAVPKYSSPQYSHTFIEWAIESITKDHSFIEDSVVTARAAATRGKFEKSP